MSNGRGVSLAVQRSDGIGNLDLIFGATKRKIAQAGVPVLPRAEHG
jgi:hypothetical protein